MEEVVCAIMATVIFCAFGTGLAVFYILEAKLDKEMREHLELIDFYDKRKREDALEIWALKRQIADLKGVEFKEPKPTLEYERYPWRER